MVIAKIKVSLLFVAFPAILGAQNFERTVFQFSAVPTLNERQNSLLQMEMNSKKTGGGAFFFKSLLVPGWGQHALGAKKAKRNFLVSEAVLLGSAIGFNVYRDWLQQDYIAFASSHAGVDPAGKDAVYWADIGDYLSIYEYNESWLRRRSLDNLRDPEAGESWQWDDLQNAQKYRSMRIDADKAKTWSQFAIAGLITNHVVSALHALWLHRKQSRMAAVNSRQYLFAFQPAVAQKGGRLEVTFFF